MTTQTRVHKKGTISLPKMMDRLRKRNDFDKVGAIALFIGVTRGETLKGEKVRKLILEAYEEKANEVLTKICANLKKRSGIVEVRIHHLLGEFKVGEDLVYVLVAGSHRGNVFPVLEEAVERYKKEAPIFKKEWRIDEKGVTTASWINEDKNQ